MKVNAAAKKAREIMATRTKQEAAPGDSDFVSTSVTLINLATYGRVNGGLAKGHIYRFIGRSQTAKSFLSRAVLAEAAINKNFSDYELVHDDIEHGVLMDTQKFFGMELVKRLKAPSYTKDKTPIFSGTTDDFYREVNKRLNKGTKFIWVEDSLDGLDSEATKMSDGKAKTHSQELRRLIPGIKATGSILILVQHAKPSMGFGWGGDVTTGGLSPEFYSTLDIWLSKLETLKRPHDDKKYPVGVRIKAFIKKNRISGNSREVKFPLYYDYGIDDIGANIDYMLDSGPWTKAKGIITAPELNFEGNTRKLLKKIEEEGLERELRVLVAKVWKGIEDACSSKRQPRYK